MIFRKYMTFVVHNPFRILGTIFVVGVSCIITILCDKNYPTFKDPQLGFETRGTLMSQRLKAHETIKHPPSYPKLLTSNPKDFSADKTKDEKFVHKKTKKGPTGVSTSNQKKKHMLTVTNHTFPEDMFCGRPDEGYAKIVIKARDGSDIFTHKILSSICNLEQQLIELPSYKLFCSTTFENHHQCCRPWSLPNYVAQMNSKNSCSLITEEDVLNSKRILEQCGPFYNTTYLNSTCLEDPTKCLIPPNCAKYETIPNILLYITDISFLAYIENSSNVSTVVTETMLFLPLPASESILEYYHEMEIADLNLTIIWVPAVDFNIKNVAFNETMVFDTIWMLIGSIIIFCVMWVYTGSIFLTTMTITVLIFSFGIGYFLYCYVFRIQFFPFLNLIAIIVILGIGTDDLFVFDKIWKSQEGTQPEQSIDIMIDKLIKASYSISITSITTATTFLSSISCQITAMRCFGIFAATTVIIIWVLMLSWMPASFVVYQSWKKARQPKLKLCRRKLKKNWLQTTKLYKLAKKCYINEDTIVSLVTKLKYFWAILFTCFICASFVILFVNPSLKLPTSDVFQMFYSDHPFEKYDMEYKYKFWFNRHDLKDADYKLPLTFVWGILPTDNGNSLDPFSKNNLLFDTTFNVYSKQSQQWLYDFCKSIRLQPFYELTNGPLLENCFIESFVKSMKKDCVDSVYNRNVSPCCKSSKFPFEPSVFNKCIIDFMIEMSETPTQYFRSGSVGPKFAKVNGNIVLETFIIEYDSIYPYTNSYLKMHNFFEEVETWFQEQLKTAPPGLKNGWFVSDFKFYDLQKMLINEMGISIAISMLITIAILLAWTFNIITSLLTILSIIGGILSTLAVLVLMGWTLGILESTAILMGIGLAVDFNLHYTIHYNLFPNRECRVESVTYALKSVLKPALMAAFTTCIAGVVMLPSSVLPYSHIGLFLLLIMVISSLFAIFYLGSLLAIFGPQNRCGRLDRKFFSKCFKRKKQDESEPCASISLMDYGERHDTARPSLNNPEIETVSPTSSMVSVALE